MAPEWSWYSIGQRILGFAQNDVGAAHRMTRLLLIEDNKGFAETLKGNLEVEGYEVDLAATGTDGLDRAKGGHYDLIILDLMLPAMNGFTVLQRLRDSGRET